MASASSSSSSGAMSNMTRLLSSSRLSSFSPRIPQVYTAPSSHISRGDFGAKRPLPTRHLKPGQVRYVDILNLDSQQGQTEWREKEREVVLMKRFNELNVRVDTFSSDSQGGASSLWSRSRKGSLGPKISTKYDSSTRRALPTDFDPLPQQDLKEELQREARLGRGPIYVDSLQSDGGAFGRMSDDYTDAPDSRVNFRRMNDKDFQKYLRQVRNKRKAFKDHLALKAAAVARARVAKQYEEVRAKLAREAKEAEARGATKVDIPALIREVDLPLLERSDDEAAAGINIDLWDEARNSSYLRLQWDPWLQTTTTDALRYPQSKLLPATAPSRGGREIPSLMHPLGGLQYGQPDSISTQLLNNSVPARVLGKTVSPNKWSFRPRVSDAEQAVAIGGRIAKLPNVVSNQSRPIDTSGNDRDRGNIQVKVVSATFEPRADVGEDLSFKRYPPNTDDRLPAPYQSTKLTVRASERSDRDSLAKGVPGSAEWIARLDGAFRSRSGHGDDRGVIDLADMNALTSGTSKLGRGSNDYSGLSPSDRRRRQKQDRLRPTRSSKKEVDNVFASIIRLHPQSKDKEPAQ